MSPMQYLVDTDWVISYQHDVPRVVSRLNALLAQGVGLSIVSLAELHEENVVSQGTQYFIILLFWF